MTGERERERGAGGHLEAAEGSLHLCLRFEYEIMGVSELGGGEIK